MQKRRRLVPIWMFAEFAPMYQEDCWGLCLHLALFVGAESSWAFSQRYEVGYWWEAASILSLNYILLLNVKISVLKNSGSPSSGIFWLDTATVTLCKLGSDGRGRFFEQKIWLPPCIRSLIQDVLLIGFSWNFHLVCDAKLLHSKNTSFILRFFLEAVSSTMNRNIFIACSGQLPWAESCCAKLTLVATCGYLWRKLLCKRETLAASCH